MILPPTAWRQRGAALFGRIGGAVAGLGIAVLLAREVSWSATPDQIPGFAKAQGFDPRGDVLRWALFLLLPILFAWTGKTVWQRFQTAARSWRIGFFGMLVALPVALTRDHGRALAVAAVAAGFCWAAVNGRLRFLSRDSIAFPVAAAHAILLWTLLVRTPLSREIGAWALGLLLFAASLSVVWISGSGNLERGAPFLGAAAPLLPLAGWGGRPEGISATVAAAGILLPLLASIVARKLPDLARWSRALAVFVLLPGCFTALAATYSFRSPSIMDVFEDGHGLTPASEYRRGEVPYRDFVPGHGFLGDGGLQFIGLALIENSYGGAILPARILGAFYWLVVFLLALAATRSPGLAFGAVALSFLAFPEYAFLRGLPSIGATALAVFASRTRSERAWFWAGLAVALSTLWAVEFACYTMPVLAVALVTARGNRTAMFRRTSLGLLTGALLMCGFFLVLGVLGEFLETTFFYVPSLLPAYATGPSRLRGFAPLAFLREKDAFFLAFCGASAVTVGTHIVRTPAIGGRARTLLPILVWVLMACLSIVERNHVEYAAALVPLGLVLLARQVKGYRPWDSLCTAAAGALLVCALVVWRPRVFVPSVADASATPSGGHNFAPFPDLPRSRGAVFSADDARIIRATREFLHTQSWKPADTWFDFSSQPGLYFLFDRDCPVRYYETGFYEAPERQAEVIEAIERNPRVRAVLMTASTWDETIDGVPNTARASRVAAFIRERFRPFYERDGVQFWLRRD